MKYGRGCIENNERVLQSCPILYHYLADMWKLRATTCKPHFTTYSQMTVIVYENHVCVWLLVTEGEQRRVWPTLASEGKLFPSLILSRLAGVCCVVVKQLSLFCRVKPVPVKLTGFLECLHLISDHLLQGDLCVISWFTSVQGWNWLWYDAWSFGQMLGCKSSQKIWNAEFCIPRRPCEEPDEVMEDFVRDWQRRPCELLWNWSAVCLLFSLPFVPLASLSLS